MKAKTKLISGELRNLPWEERPNGCQDVVWRYSKNPVIKRDAIPSSNSVFNSAVIPYNGGFAGVFRVDSTSREMRLHSGFSEDGFNWRIEHNPIDFKSADPSDPEVGKSYSMYDPRVCRIGDRNYITWCNGYYGPTIGIGFTDDFREFFQSENAFLPYNRNGVLFPREINGKFAMLSRPSDKGHTAFGDIFYSESPDLIHWGKHRHVMGTRRGWQDTKVGAGPVPIETSEGWLLIYHGVLTSCNGFVYSMGAALLDLASPWKVICRAKPYILSPRTDYECVGDVPNVVFPCAALHDALTGRIAIYYGCADTVVGVAFSVVDELVAFIKDNPAEG